MLINRPNKRPGSIYVHVYTTFAEITRVCNEQLQKYEYQTDGEIFILRLAGRKPVRLYAIQHPSVDFNIYSNGQYYFIDDNGKQSLYKLRE